MEFYPPHVESYQQSWALDFWHKELLPRAKAAGAANEVVAFPWEMERKFDPKMAGKATAIGIEAVVHYMLKPWASGCF